MPIDLSVRLSNLLLKVGRDTNHQPAPCWIWPGPFAKGLPIHRTPTGTASVTKTLVEHFNSPIPKHPHTGKPTYFVRRCQLNRECVNPYHARVLPYRDLWEVNVSYNQQRFYFPEELRDMDPEYVQYLRQQGLAA
jgi:hypothetical protein